MPAPRTHAKPAALTGRPRVQTQWVWGSRERRRWSVFALKLGIFLTLPWLTVSGHPALLFDIPARRYHVFGAVFWPQDFYMLGLLLALAAVLLFVTTALVGRIFCGFACPHTLLTSLFMLVDHWVEGDRPARLALDAGTAPLARRARRVLKHAVWLAVAAGLGFTFVSYFTGARALLSQVATLSVGAAPLATWIAVSAVTYLFAGHLRDWVCTTVCPYGRFQGAMQDPDSLIVTYDAVRGEPRAKSRETIARGGCVDCGMCVAACPMGIDIRQGPQYECITCMRCLDACDATMGKLGAPPSLIRMASANEWAARTSEAATPLPPLAHRRWFRPRLAWYGLVLAALVGGLALLAWQRPLLALEAERDRHAAFVLPEGDASNLYALTLLNKDAKPRTVTLDIYGLEGRLVPPPAPITLPPGAHAPLKASVLAAPGERPKPFHFLLRDAATGAVVDSAPATFVPPGGLR